MRQRRGASQKNIPIGMANGAVHRKNRRRAVSYASTGLLAYPVTPAAHATTAEVRL